MPVASGDFALPPADSLHNLPIAPNVLDRKFIVAAPNQAWVGDVTYIATDEGWLFLAVVIDLFSRKVVGWSMRPGYAAQPGGLMLWRWPGMGVIQARRPRLIFIEIAAANMPATTSVRYSKSMALHHP